MVIFKVNYKLNLSDKAMDFEKSLTYNVLQTKKDKLKIIFYFTVFVLSMSNTLTFLEVNSATFS